MVLGLSVPYAGLFASRLQLVLLATYVTERVLVPGDLLTVSGQGKVSHGSASDSDMDLRCTSCSLTLVTDCTMRVS